MDFGLPDEILKYKNEAREWVETVLDPLSKPLEEEEKLPDELVAELKKGRFFGLTIPQEYGGQGWNAVEYEQQPLGPKEMKMAKCFDHDDASTVRRRAGRSKTKASRRSAM